MLIPTYFIAPFVEAPIHTTFHNCIRLLLYKVLLAHLLIDRARVCSAVWVTTKGGVCNSEGCFGYAPGDSIVLFAIYSLAYN